jgi:AP-1-like factor
MSDFESMYGQGLYLSPQQQDLLMAALASNSQSGAGNNQQSALRSPSNSNSNSNSHLNQSPSLSHSQNFDLTSSTYLESPIQDIPGSGTLGAGSDESPFLDFDPDESYDYPGGDQLIGDLPEYDDQDDEYESREKRKSIDGDSDEMESGKKRRESDGDKDKSAKKPGRKPLTSEPTSVR